MRCSRAAPHSSLWEMNVRPATFDATDQEANPPVFSLTRVGNAGLLQYVWVALYPFDAHQQVGEEMFVPCSCDLIIFIIIIISKSDYLSPLKCSVSYPDDKRATILPC